MYKIKDIETRINNKNVDIGDIGCRFYTEDENTAYVRIGINDEKGRINFKESNLTPKLHLFLEDGSIFKNEPVLTDDNVKGFLTYKIPKNVIKHVGMVRCKLFLENDRERIHVANFHFYIIDSGIDDTVQKEVSITLVEDTVKRIIRTSASELLGDDFKETLNTTAKQYIAENADKFKGERGERGEKGEVGERGAEGVIRFENLTQEQRNELKGEAGENIIKDNAVTYNKTDFIKTGKNIFDTTDIEVGRIVSNTTGIVSDSAYYVTSKFLPVAPNTVYTQNYADPIAFYDINKTFISGLARVTNPKGSRTFTTPTNAYYIKATSIKEGVDTYNYKVYQIEKNDKYTGYEPFKLNLP